MVKSERRDERIAVAIDQEKGSQSALKWAVDNLLAPGETLTLIHVRVKQNTANGTYPNKIGDDVYELFLPFHCFCSTKDIKCEDVILEDVDAAKGIISYVKGNAIDVLVLGASKLSLLKRLKSADITNAVMKGSPSFCTVYTISRGKISSSRSATSSPPPLCSIRPSIPARSSNASSKNSITKAERRVQSIQRTQDEFEIKSPFLRKGYEGTYQAPSLDTDLSFVSSDRAGVDWMLPKPLISVSTESEENSFSFARSSCSSEQQSIESSSYSAFSLSSLESGRLSSWSQHDEVETELRRLKMELKFTMNMYSNACKEAITAKKTSAELQNWKEEREVKIEEARLAKEAAMKMAENEKVKSRAAMEAVEAAQRMAEIENQKRNQIEMAALREVEDNNREMPSFAQSNRLYRKLL